MSDLELFNESDDAPTQRTRRRGSIKRSNTQKRPRGSTGSPSSIRPTRRTRTQSPQAVSSVLEHQNTRELILGRFPIEPMRRSLRELQLQIEYKDKVGRVSNDVYRAMMALGHQESENEPQDMHDFTSEALRKHYDISASQDGHSSSSQQTTWFSPRAILQKSRSATPKSQSELTSEALGLAISRVDTSAIETMRENGFGWPEKSKVETNIPNRNKKVYNLAKKYLRAEIYTESSWPATEEKNDLCKRVWRMAWEHEGNRLSGYDRFEKCDMPDANPSGQTLSILQKRIPSYRGAWAQVAKKNVHLWYKLDLNDKNVLKQQIEHLTGVQKNAWMCSPDPRNENKQRAFVRDEIVFLLREVLFENGQSYGRDADIEHYFRTSSWECICLATAALHCALRDYASGTRTAASKTDFSTEIYGSERKRGSQGGIHQRLLNTVRSLGVERRKFLREKLWSAARAGWEKELKEAQRVDPIQDDMGDEVDDLDDWEPGNLAADS